MRPESRKVVNLRWWWSQF